MPNKARLDKEAREIVWRVSEYFRKECNSNTADYVDKTVAACGVSRATVYRIRKEKEEPKDDAKAKKVKPVTVFDEERYLIRKALYEFQQEEGGPPTLEQLRVRLQSSMNFGGDERMLRKMLKRQGFFLKKIDSPLKHDEPTPAEEEEEATEEPVTHEEEMQELQTDEEERINENTQEDAAVRIKMEHDQTDQKVQISSQAIRIPQDGQPINQKMQVIPVAKLSQDEQRVPQRIQVMPIGLINHKTKVNQKPQIYEIVGVGKGGQVILKPQMSQQARLVQKGSITASTRTIQLK